MMITERLQRAWLIGCAAVLAGAGVAAVWSPRMAAGVAAGGGWNLVSLWCLAQLLKAWIGPAASKRRAVIWAAVKFPLLYVGAYALMSHPAISLIGFGIGFTIVLLIMLGALVMGAQQLTAASRHGR